VGGDTEVTRIATLSVSPTAACRTFAQQLAHALAGHAATLHVDSQRAAAAADGGAAAVSDWLTGQERRHRYLVYECDPDATSWTALCLRRADNVVVVADAAAPPDLGWAAPMAQRAGAAPTATGRTLVLLQPRGAAIPRGTAAWLRLGDFGQHFHVREGRDSDVERVTRCLTGRAVGLVLGGGGARGFAHVGVIRAMQEAGIPIDYAGGTSMGALIAAQAAGGRNTDEILNGTLRGTKGTLDLTVPFVSLMSARRAARDLTAQVGETQIEDLWLPYFAVSANLTRAMPHVHRRGALVPAILASNAAPGIFPPVVDGNELLVDGGVLNVLPVDVMRSVMDGGSVIAVDVDPHAQLEASYDYGYGLSGWRVLLNRLNPFAQTVRLPSIVDVITRAGQLGGLARRESTAQLADVCVQPDVARFGMVEYGRGREIAEAGYQAARAALEAWRPPA
jgi:predicted acylesterase/phospholipase RssA